MKRYVFNYYKNFKCIADKCKHSCCVGWTVGIDKKSLKAYKKDKSVISKRLRDSIDFENSCFFLDENRRCVFLNDKNLCDLFINNGEESLCQVCRDHPRFRSFFKGRVETGLGLCCEEACRIILNSKDKMRLVSLDDKKERLSKKDENLIFCREKIISVIQNRNLSVKERLKKLFYKADFISSEFLLEYKKILLEIETISSTWCETLSKAKLSYFDELELFSPILFEHLASYFVFRHFAFAEDDFDMYVELVFSILSALTILTVSKELNIDVFDFAREYSAEIEYSKENLGKIKDFIERQHRLCLI